MLVIQQKGISQDGANKKTKLAKFSEKRTFKKRSFFGKFGELCFLVTCLEILPFALSPIKILFSLIYCLVPNNRTPTFFFFFFKKGF